MVFTTIDQGQLAWTWVEYGTDGPRWAPLRCRTPRSAPRTAVQHAPACWIEAVFDTEDGYHDDHGGPGALHQRLVTAWASGSTPRRSGGHGAPTATASSTTAVTALQDSHCETSNGYA
jgi:hypothetical protein